MSASPIAILRAAGIGLVLLALLTGLPWLFLHTWFSGVVTWPDTVTWPDWNTDLAAPPRHEQAVDWASETYHDLRIVLGGDGALVLLFLAAGWVSWAALVAAVVTDLLVLARHGITSLRARIDTSPRGLITAAVCSTVLLGSVSPAMAATSPAAAPPAATAPQHPGSTEHTAPANDTRTGAGEMLDEPPVYTTFRGDTLWDVADRYLHDPRRWPEIMAVNPDLDDTGLLQPGQHLRMPEPCWLVDPLPAPEGSHTVTVQRGDTLSDIAAGELGDAGRWVELFDLNTHHRQPDARTLLDPDFLFPGWQITIPPQASNPAPQPDDGAAEPGHDSVPMWTLAHPLRDGLSSRPLGESVEVDRNAVRGVELRDGTVLGAAACASALAVLFVAGRRVHRITARRASTRERAPSITHAVDIAEYLPLSKVVTPEDVDLGGGGVPAGDGESFELPEDAGSDVSPTEPARPAAGERFLLDLGVTDEELVGVDIAAAGGLGVLGPAAGHVVRSLVGQGLARHSRERVLLHTSASDALAEPGGSCALTPVDDSALTASAAHSSKLVVVDTQHLTDTMRRWLTEKPAGVVVLALGDWPTGLTLSTDDRGVITAVVPHHDGFEGLRVFTDSDQASSGGFDSRPVSGLTARGDSDAETLDSADSQGCSSSERVCDRPVQTQAVLVVQLLGAVQFAVRDGDGARRDITDKLSPRLRELLVYLAVHPDGVARETLVDDVWQDSPPARPTNALNTAVSRLRTSLAQAAEVNVEDILGGTKRELGLVAQHVDVDYWHFVRADHRARATSGEQRAAAWEEVVGLYAGSLAPEISSLWIHAARQAAQSAAVNAVAGLARQHAQEDPQRALQLVEFGTHIDPLNEHLYRDIMRLQSRLGHAEALPHTLALLRTRLQEAGMEPSGEIEELARKLLDRHATTGP